MKTKRDLLPLFLSCALPLVSVAADWPSWRGPEADGSVAEGELPAKLEVAWKAELPGRGCSTPVVSGEQIFLTAPVENKDALISFGSDGQEKWRLVFGEQRPGRGQRTGSGANSSPLIHEGKVFAYFKSGLVVAADLSGKELWRTNLIEHYGEDKLWWDQGTTPVIADGKLVIAVMQTDGKSYLVALDPASGKEVWFTEREFEVKKETGDSYTTPHVAEVDGVETIISFGADHIAGHAAKDGKLLWSSAGLNPEKKAMWRTIASSVYVDGVVVVPHGRGEFLAGIKAGGAGDVTEKALLWREKIESTDAATPVGLPGGRVLLLADRGRTRGTVTLLEARSGEVIWQDELPKAAGTYYSSPIVVGEQACFAREDGGVFIATLGEKGLENVVEGKLDDSFIASPIYAHDRLILRGDRFLWGLAEK